MSKTLNPGREVFWTDKGTPSLPLANTAGATHAFKSSLDPSRLRHGTLLDGRTVLHNETDDTPGFSLPSLGTATLATGERCGSSLLLATSSFLSMESKSHNVPFSKTTSTFLLDSRSLLPGPSLLSDTPSFLKLANIHAPKAAAAPLALTSSPEFTLREPRASLDSTRSSPTNRSVTVQRLALDLPLSCSSSLSVFLQALEDAAPGWYQSLMDSAVPRESESLLTASAPSSPSSTRYQAHHDPNSDAPYHGLPPDMMESLDALEAIASRVQCLPLPRSRRKVREDIIVEEDAYFRSSRTRQSTVRPAEAQLASPPLTPTDPEGDHERPPPSPWAATPQHRRRRETTGSQRPPEFLGRPPTSSRISSNPTQSYTPAMSNVANHPKLARTLGLGATTPSRLPTPSAPYTRPPSVPAPPAEPLLPLTLNKKASSRSLKTPTPKTPKAFKSIFRPRMSAPPVPPLTSFAPEYDEADSPVRRPPLASYRFSEAGLRREDRRIDDAKRHFSSGNAPRVSVGRHACAADADSFLVL
ncbi:hypothetical protein C2E23DRAFT_580329 [Lenzites betulinus]|nr:hypothetical protein C2E23DRAFT_580329 [Lenzites betulinus]